MDASPVSSETIIEDTIAEVEERHRKFKNLVIFNIEEP